MSECAKQPAKVVHLSEHLANNAAALHILANPFCSGMETFACGDHFHIGHHSRERGKECQNHPEHLAAQQRRHRG